MGKRANKIILKKVQFTVDKVRKGCHTKLILNCILIYSYFKGVITLGNTIKKVTTHHVSKNTRTDLYGTFTLTSCGRGLYSITKANKTWKGVTCKRCLATKNKKGRLNQRVAKTYKSTFAKTAVSNFEIGGSL